MSKKKGLTVTYTLCEDDHKNAIKEFSNMIKNYIDSLVVKMVIKYLTRKKSIEKRRVRLVVKRAKKKLITKTQNYDSKRRSHRVV
jgi:hypothetical protein